MLACRTLIHVDCMRFQVTCDHSGRILAATAGFPGTWNDKTMVRYDVFISEVRMNARYVYTGIEYELYNAEGVKVTRRGAYLIADGGYHRHLRSCSRSPSFSFRSTGSGGNHPL